MYQRFCGGLSWCRSVTSMDAKNWVKLVAAGAGAWIGYSLGASIASGLVADATSFWARAGLAGFVLQFGGMAVGAIVALLVTSKVLGD
jgi:hypothetical protein